jgi:ureidoacrylate peracid hydrolase
MDADFRDLVDPGHSALIVIDVQNDSCHPDGLYAQKGLDVSLRRQSGHNVAAFIPECRRFGVPIIFTKVSHTAWDQSRAQARRRKGLGSESCIQGTWGEELYLVQPIEGEPVIAKHRYSAFIATDLDLLLRSRGITTILLTGGGTNACVEATAMHGYMLDYDVVVIADCCGTPTIEEHEPALKRMARMCATIVQSQDLLQAWSTTPAPVGA